MFNDPTLKGSVLPYMQTGVLLGRMTQATTLAVISNTQLAILGLSKGGVSKLASRMFLPVTLGVEGLQFATAYHEYSLGRISQRDLYRRTASHAMIMMYTSLELGIAIEAGLLEDKPKLDYGHYQLTSSVLSPARSQQFRFNLPAVRY